MITILNNCLRLIELGTELETLFGKAGLPHALAENFKKLRQTYIVSVYLIIVICNLHFCCF